jgi:hypothetical protein
MTWTNYATLISRETWINYATLISRETWINDATQIGRTMDRNRPGDMEQPRYKDLHETWINHATQISQMTDPLWPYRSAGRHGSAVL